MKVILKKDFQNLGEAADIVNVKDGYARNYLLPQGYAEIATEGAIANREKNIARIKAKQEKLHKEALALIEEIQKLEKLELSARAGESGKLFGTITTKKLSEELAAKGFSIDKKSIILDAPINKIGEYKMTLKITSKVKGELPVIVTASEIVSDHIEEVEEEPEKKAEEVQE